jgi:TP901 family phage tail tape measure protein
VADRSITVRVGAKVTGVVAGFRTAGKASQDFSNRLIASAGRNSAALSTLSRGIGVVGIGLSGLAGKAVNAFAGFDAASSLGALREAALTAGRDTAWSASQAAGGIEELVKAGVSASDVLEGGLSGALSLASAGEMDVAEAAEIASIALTQFELAGSDVSHVADLLAAGAAKALGDVSDLGAALKQSGLVASQTGLSIEETTAALSAFAAAGLLGSDAGTSFKTMLQRLTPQSGEAEQMMTDLGISAYNAQGEFVGLEQFAGNLQTALSGLSDEQRNAALSVMFGSDAVRAASVLYSEGAEGIRDWTAAVDDQGYAADVAATRLDNLSGDLTIFRGSIETAFISLGEAADGPLRNLVQGATNAVNAFAELPGPIHSGLLSIIGGGGLVALGVAGLAKLVISVAETRSAMDDLAKSGSRIPGVMRGIGRAARYGAVLTAAFAALTAGVEALADGMAETASTVDETMRVLLHLNEATDLDQLFAGVGYGADEVESLHGAISRLVSPDLQDRVQDVGGAIRGFFGGGGTGADRIREQFEVIGQALGELVAGGEIERATNLFRQLAAEWEAQGGDIEDLRALMPAYTDALAANATETELAAGAAEELAGSTDAIADSAETASTALLDLIDAQREASGEAASAMEAQAGYQQALADASAALKENGATLDLATQAGRDNQAALLGINDATWELVDSLAANGASMSETRAAMAQGREQFIRTAESMGMETSEAEALADQLGLIPGSVSTLVNVSDEEARRRTDAFIHAYSGRTIPMTVSIRASVGAMSDAAYAAFSRVYGGFAAGGYTGDAPPRTIAGVVHGKEFVVNARATATHRPLLEAINRATPGYAAGGFVAPPATTGTPQVAVSLPTDGWQVTGRLEMGSDGFARLVDGRIRVAQRSRTLSRAQGVR